MLILYLGLLLVEAVPLPQEVLNLLPARAEFRPRDLHHYDGALQGNQESIQQLGMLLVGGKRIQANPELGITLLQQLANPDAHVLHILAKHSESQGPEHYQRALGYYERAVKGGHVPSMLAVGDLNFRMLLGDRYLFTTENQIREFRSMLPDRIAAIFNLERRDLAKPEFERMVNAYKRAASLGDVQARFIVSIFQSLGYGMHLDSATGLRTLSELSQIDDAAAVFRYSLTVNNQWATEEKTAAFQALVKAAGRGNVRIQKLVADRYVQMMEYQQAEHWYKVAAAQKDSDAMLSLALHVVNFVPDRRTQLEMQKHWLKEAATNGHLGALELLKWIGGVSDDTSVTSFLADTYLARNDLFNALPYLTIGISKKNPKSYYDLAMGIRSSIDAGPGDSALVVIGLTHAANLGHAPALREIGLLYGMNHAGRPNSILKSIFYLDHAARLGDARAKTVLARLLLQESENLEFKMTMIQPLKEASKEDAEANRLLAELFEKGEIVQQSQFMATVLYSRAARMGDPASRAKLEGSRDPEAQAALGQMYAEGKGVPQDDKEAYKYYMQALNKGDRPAMLLLAEHARKEGDVDEAIHWTNEFALSKRKIQPEDANRTERSRKRARTGNP